MTRSEFRCLCALVVVAAHLPPLMAAVCAAGLIVVDWYEELRK